LALTIGGNSSEEFTATNNSIMSSRSSNNNTEFSHPNTQDGILLENIKGSSSEYVLEEILDSPIGGYNDGYGKKGKEWLEYSPRMYAAVRCNSQLFTPIGITTIQTTVNHNNTNNIQVYNSNNDEAELHLTTQYIRNFLDLIIIPGMSIDDALQLCRYQEQQDIWKQTQGNESLLLLNSPFARVGKQVRDLNKMIVKNNTIIHHKDALKKNRLWINGWISQQGEEMKEFVQYLKQEIHNIAPPLNCIILSTNEHDKQPSNGNDESSMTNVEWIEMINALIVIKENNSTTSSISHFVSFIEIIENHFHKIMSREELSFSESNSSSSSSNSAIIPRMKKIINIEPSPFARLVFPLTNRHDQQQQQQQHYVMVDLKIILESDTWLAQEYFSRNQDEIMAIYERVFLEKLQQQNQQNILPTLFPGFRTFRNVIKLKVKKAKGWNDLCNLFLVKKL
jgi:uncharacterized protein YqcC (DUF446 family)